MTLSWSYYNGPFVLIRERGPWTFKLPTYAEFGIKWLTDDGSKLSCPFSKMHGNWAVLESMFRKGEEGGGGQTAIKRPDVGYGGKYFCCLLLGNILANCLQAKIDQLKTTKHFEVHIHSDKRTSTITINIRIRRRTLIGPMPSLDLPFPNVENGSIMSRALQWGSLMINVLRILKTFICCPPIPVFLLNLVSRHTKKIEMRRKKNSQN